MLLGFLVVVVGGVGYVAALPVTPTPRETTIINKACRNKQSDIYFLLDSSSSLLPRDFEKVRNFVVSFVEMLDIAPDATRVGLGVFANDFYGQFEFGEHSNKSEVVEAIRRVPHYGGGTYTGKGLLGMRTTGFREGVVRKNATKIGVVITDGRSRHRTNTITEAGQLKDEGVWLFAIGVTRGVDTNELSIFASVPQTDFIRHVNTFGDLTRLTNGLVHRACRLQAPHADNATCGRQQKADIMFIYNAAAMNVTSVMNVQNFTKDVIQAFSMTSGNVRVGVISEGRQGGDIPLSQYIRREDFVQALQHLHKPELAPLLRKARQQGYDPHSGGRPNAKKFAIVFVDDINVSADALWEAHMMRFNDINVYVIGVGLGREKGRVEELSTSQSRFSRFQSYANLRNDTEQQKFIRNLCESV
ncbi:hypothetical protein ACOMHN_001141 [Nucella lapillus]